jgi:hypothetical protein
MPLSKNFAPGAAIASACMSENLLSLLFQKGVINRGEMFELLETTLLKLEQLQADFAVSPKNAEFQSQLQAARSVIESTRITLKTRHPSNPDSRQNLES